MQANDWDDLRFVLAVARSQTFAEAARKLGVNETTVARRIDRAEQVLGARLFDRSLGRLRPTPAGAIVAGRAERIEHEVETLVGAPAGTDSLVAGSLRLTAVPILVIRRLLP